MVAVREVYEAFQLRGCAGKPVNVEHDYRIYAARLDGMKQPFILGPALGLRCTYVVVSEHFGELPAAPLGFPCAVVNLPGNT
jgi:hypothetical protein